MSTNVSNYGVQDIKTLEGIEAIRLRRHSDMMAWCIANQYELPGRLHLYAKYYPNVSFNQALKLYELAVEEIIVIFNAKHLFDTPLSYGRGLVYAKDKWLQKMQQAEEIAAADNNCDASAISKVCNGKRNKCGGFKWKYQTM